MSLRPRRLHLIGGAVGLLLITALAVLPLVNLDHYKPRFEAAASKALGMDVRIGGRLRIGVFPGLHLTVGDLRVLDERAVTVGSAKRTRVWAALVPLLFGQFRVSGVELKQPLLSIERAPDGSLNVGKLKHAGAPLGDLGGMRASLSDGILRYSNEMSGAAIEFLNLDMSVSGLRFGGGNGPQSRKLMALEARLACGEIRTKDHFASDLKVSVHGKDGVFEFEPVTMRVRGGQATGSLQLDTSGPVPLSRVRCSVPSFRIEEFLKIPSPDVTLQGATSFSARLAMQGATVNQLIRTAEGEVSLRGRDLTLVGSDLDRALSRFESSQSFNLVDVGAVFLAGPLGLAVTRSFSFASLFVGSGDSSSIGILVSDWKVERGIARAKDVAMTTARNRIALQGGLNFVDRQFDEVTMAVVDPQGCPKVRQAISGSFEEPVLEKPHVLTSLAGPVLKVVKQTRALLPEGPCEVFYSGSVAPPKQE